MKIKICGMKDFPNIQAVAALQPDFLGFIFYPQSLRYAEPLPSEMSPTSLSADKMTVLSATIRKIGVFVNEQPDIILQTVKKYHLDGIQLHGTESPEYCRKLKENLKSDQMYTKSLLIKAFSIATTEDLPATKDYTDCCDLFLFDTACKEYGGSGRHFSWDILDNYHGKTDFLLSGGIGPNDAGRLNAYHHPHCIGIDLNSRFETSPGIKNVDALKIFLADILHTTDPTTI